VTPIAKWLGIFFS